MAGRDAMDGTDARDGTGALDDERASGSLAGLPDLGGLSLAEVDRLGDTVLGACLRRVMDEADAAPEAIAGFNAIID